MAPPTFTSEQIKRYLDRIKLPEHRRKYAIGGCDALEYLRLLQQHHLVAIPFENLSLHYGPGRITLQPDALFSKIIDGKGRGGYCMENNLLFGILLRSLGYRLYPVGARVSEGPAGYTGYGHMVNLVIINGQKYHVDVGFGGNGPIQPLPLNKDETKFDGIWPASHRLLWKNIEANTDPDQRLWVLQHQKEALSEWEDLICYGELEFTAADYNVMNYYTSTSRHVFFTSQIVSVRMFFGRANKHQDEIVGVYILSKDSLKERAYAQTDHLADFKSEEERLDALKEYFGIDFTDVDKEAIRGLPSAIGPGPEL